MSIWRGEGHVRGRGLLIAITVLLTISALIAVAILLLGTSGDIEGRILITTMALAGYGVAALPGAMLLDAGRARLLAYGLIGVAVTGAVLITTTVWLGDDPPVSLSKSAFSAAIVTTAVAQVAALVVRFRATDPPVVRALFTASTVLAAVIAGMALVMIWAESGSDFAGRLLGSLIVLDALAVALHPLLARAGAAAVEVRLRIVGEPGGPQEVTARGRDLATAVAGAIREAEGEGRRVRGIEVLGETAPAPPARIPSPEEPVRA